jgi:lipopolysaccharide transport system ATP-binding protein
MSDIAIRCEGLSKQYRIGKRERYRALRDVLTDGLSAPFRALGSAFRNGSSIRNSSPQSSILNPQSSLFWALDDVSFEVNHGEVVGIIGRNGAGKSTLLKILSRITDPTRGFAEINGRVGSLLEVGTGFHPELTGRENIYLNGAILGMKRAQIERKFDEIVDFAETEKFLDTPVKYYSSGMHVRLAFAVAAHLEPDILLVDEVLSVGDLAFQKKCLGKMGDVAETGRTVVFVSHQMNQIRRLCERCIWMDSGRIKRIGSMVETVGAYESASSSLAVDLERDVVDDHLPARFLKWDIVEPHVEEPHVLTEMGPVTVRFLLKVNRRIWNGHHGIALFSNEHQLMWGTDTNNLTLEPGLYSLVYTLPVLPLRPSVYFWRVSIYEKSELLDAWDSVPGLVVGTQPLGHSRDQWSGLLNMPYEFSIENSSSQQCSI